MDSFEFSCFGHENILALHSNTLEFTKDSELTKNGDCIIGVKSDFDSGELARFADENKSNKINCKITSDNLHDEFSFFLNPDFSNEHELVIRIGEFKSKRTLGIKSDKAACNINRELVRKIKDKKREINVRFTITT
jgi:uncharacterized protein